MKKLTLTATTLAVSAASASGTLAGPQSNPAWYERLRKPSYQPPGIAFPVVWTALYGDIATTSAVAIDRFQAAEEHDKARGYIAALGVNLALNAG
jgi:benzodiazapine receptor